MNDHDLGNREGKEQPTITKIVITGGPCAGKTTAMSWIQNEFTQMGYTVLFVAATATQLITGGVAPWTCGTNCEFQKCQLSMHLPGDAASEDYVSEICIPVKKK